MSEPEYNLNDIEWTDAVEVVRRRPTMYVGDVSSGGLHELLTILLDDVVGDAQALPFTTLTITLANDGSIQAEDDGRSIPVDIDERSGRSRLETVFTLGGKPRRAREKRSMYGLEVWAVNALSEWLVVETSHGGRRYRIRFERGRTIDMESLGTASVAGITIRFAPDRSIFESNARIDRDRLIAELKGFAALLPAVSLTLRDERTSPAFSAVVR